MQAEANEAPLLAFSRQAGFPTEGGEA